MAKQDNEVTLFTDAQESMGDKYHDSLMKQYELYVNLTDETSARRLRTNEFFITLNSVLLAIMGLITQITGCSRGVMISWIIFVGVFGSFLSNIWRQMIQSYKILNKGRYDVIWKIEERLPLKMYEYEWDFLEKANYVELTEGEKNIPLIFIIIYAIWVVFLLLILYQII